MPKIVIGMDVGSTTVKAVVMETTTKEILWSKYSRHESKQGEYVLSFFNEIEEALPKTLKNAEVFFTGSGGASLAELINAKFVQEVNAVSLATEHLHPDIGSVIELGGQDSKIIIWKVDPKTNSKRKYPSMNDKCAGGTGAVIDKICSKLRIPPENLQSLNYHGVRIHPVAGKCGVFAETDINGLQKQGVPSDELLVSLLDSIVLQNLAVLTRGSTLQPKVVLLGGPNCFLPALVQAWKYHIPKIWKERLPDFDEATANIDEMIITPKNSELYVAIGTALYGIEDPSGLQVDVNKLTEFIETGRENSLKGDAEGPLVDDISEVDILKEKARIRHAEEKKLFMPGQKVEAWLGLDGGSTSTKGVLIDREGNLIAKSYELSKGNPFDDAKLIIKNLYDYVEQDGAELEIKGFGTTGYAKDILKDTLKADVAVVETVAHMLSSVHYYNNVDVIVDVGGQDIKVIFLNNGIVRDFKLNTQCSAGNGYFLQSTAAKFNVKVEDFADHAFRAKIVPRFSYGCAVFMESDIVNFQRLGWQSHEIMGGLAKVLPKNIWLYVVQEPNLKKYGTNFILQGGTQRNIAAVKSQSDYIAERVPNANVQVHKYCGESGAIGAALESLRLTKDIGFTRYPGLNHTLRLLVDTQRNEDTRCYFCSNKCLRTFITTKDEVTKDETRFIIATCEKGMTTDSKEVKEIRKQQKALEKKYPNLIAQSAKLCFTSFSPETVASPAPKTLKSIFKKSGPTFDEIVEKRKLIKIGMPRALNFYSTAPFFRTYLESLGVKKIVWSDFTSEELFKEGGKRGSIDQCFPAKISISHIHNLVFKKKPDVIYYPTLINLKDRLVNTQDSCACPTVQSAPNVGKSAFTKEGDIFAENNITFIDDALHMNEPELFKKEMFDTFKDLLNLHEEESNKAVDEGWKALDKYHETLTTQSREILQELERENRIGILMIGRPYHNDPGLNHEIFVEIQKLGYPILVAEALPDSKEELEKLFGDDLRAGKIKHPKEVNDVFGNPYSTNTNTKLWAAKYAARHPNIAVIDLSSFKCGHDAPIYHIIDRIMETSETPYFTFHDIDENKPSGSIKIRVETIDYTLQRYREKLAKKNVYINKTVFEAVEA